MKINLSDQYWVQLTGAGKAQWVKWHRDLGCDTPVRQADKDGWVQLPLWEISLIFGPSLYMGNNKLPFTTMNLYRDRPSSI
jgi:hypothetical protein